ncbi:MAG: hypothetical protein JKY26_07435 [Pseudomonas sp.]|nr:hypothetical protein [Pseudomonas sp.]
MRFLIVPFLFALAPMCGADSPNGQDSAVPAKWQTQCFGRLQFSIPSASSWFNQENEVKPSDNTHHPSAIWSGNYGSDPLHPEKWLVRIVVNRAATLEAWQRATNHYIPNKGAAQYRFIQTQIDAIDEQMEHLRTQYPDYQENPEYSEAHKKLRDEQRTLEETQRHIRKISSDLSVLTLLIEEYEAHGRDADRLKASLPELQAETEKHPTDELFKSEYMLDAGLPNSRAVSRADSLVVTHWRDNRIFTFEFGMQHDQPSSQQKSLEPAALDFLARFRARPEHEIPTEPGVCLPFGFIADDGNAPFDFAYQWQPRSKPALLYRIDQPASKELFSMAMRRLIPNAYPSLLQVNRFGPEDVPFGYQAGSLVGTRFQRRDGERPDWHPPETYHLIAETGPQQLVPSVSFEMKIQDPDAEFPSFEQGQAEFKQILDSFRPLPGMTTEQAVDP